MLTQIKNYNQIVIYIVVGVFCACLDIGVMQFLIFLNVNYILAATISFFISFLINYISHTSFTFKSIVTPNSFIKFSSIVCLNYVITIGMIYAAFSTIGSALFGKVISLPVIAINGFVLSKYWAFRSS